MGISRRSGLVLRRRARRGAGAWPAGSACMGPMTCGRCCS